MDSQCLQIKLIRKMIIDFVVEIATRNVAKP